MKMAASGRPFASVLLSGVARETGLEPATSGVTGRRSNQLSYTRAFSRVPVEERPRREARELGDAPFTVNKLVLIFLLVADVSQRAVLEEESGDIGRPGRRSITIHCSPS